MALRNAILDQIQDYDLEALFQTADTVSLWEEMKSKADTLFSPFLHLLHSPPDWIEDNWKRAEQYNFLLDVPGDLKPKTVLDINQAVRGVDLTRPPKDRNPILFFFSRQYGHWNINRAGEGIRSVIGCDSSVGSCPIKELPAYWKKIDDAMHEIASFIEIEDETGSMSAKFEAGAFYANMTKSGDGPWDSYKDLSVLFHLVLPQFFPVHYLQTKDGYSQEKGMLRLLDTLAALTGQPRKSVSLDEYIPYSAVYRVLLALYDHWVREKQHETPHFDYFTQFLADLTSRSNPESLLLYKKALIFYGIPGTSKTHNALDLAKRVAEEEHVRLIQFHPNYSYQDFIIGIRPQISESGNVSYGVEPGILYRAAAEAAQAWIQKTSSKDSSDGNENSDEEEPASAAEEGRPHEEKEKPYRFVLVIDEINRADLAKVLGEVMYCIEYRPGHPEWKPLLLPHTLSLGAKLASPFKSVDPISDPFEGGKSFYLPENLYIIGAMNDADRSISGFDKALRRRFAWSRMDFCPVTMRQMIEAPFKKAERPAPENLPQFILRVQALNQRIRNGNASEDENNYELRLPLKGMEIGHTYFAEIVKVMKMTPTRAGNINPLHLDHLWIYFIEPLLEEMIGGEIELFNGPIGKLKDFFTSTL